MHVAVALGGVSGDGGGSLLLSGHDGALLVNLRGDTAMTISSNKQQQATGNR